jgi:phosphogluconate dehydratase
LRSHCTEPFLEGDKVVWKPAPEVSGDENVLRPAAAPFSADGGLKLLTGNLGRSVIKISAVKPQYRVVEAPALVFDSQEAFMHAFKAGELNRDFVAVVRYQGPRANGMPELHALTPALGSLQDAGRHVALVTDGRMSGASGKVPAAIHVSPEVLAGGALARVRNGDMIRLDAEKGILEALVPTGEWEARVNEAADLSGNHVGMGRELFSMFRASVSAAEEGAATFPLPPPLQAPEKSDNPQAVPEDQSFSDEDSLITRR